MTGLTDLRPAAQSTAQNFEGQTMPTDCAVAILTDMFSLLNRKRSIYPRGTEGICVTYAQKRVLWISPRRSRHRWRVASRTRKRLPRKPSTSSLSTQRPTADNRIARAVTPVSGVANLVAQKIELGQA